MFNGFTEKTSEFMWDLKFNNERPWFQEHKQEFLTYLKEPFDAFSAEVYEKVSAAHPDYEWQLHIARIYRDARRLFGRGPYKENLWFTIWRGSSKHDNPAFWFEINASHFEFGTGFFALDATQMERYRTAIDANPAAMEKLTERLLADGRFALCGEEYKKRKGNHVPAVDIWYNRKNVSLIHEEDFGGVLLTPQITEYVADAFEFLMPYYDFFDRVVH